MKLVILFILIFISQGCSKQKTVLICGDHACINKTEAEQYFEDNLTLEVKIINRNNEEELDLVQLNLRDNKVNIREINIIQKKSTNEEIKILSNDEIKKIKLKIKNKKEINNNKTAKKLDKARNKNKKISKNNKKKDKQKNKFIKTNKSVNKNRKEIVDVCTILAKCSINEISDYLLKIESKKNFPDITNRE